MASAFGFSVPTAVRFGEGVSAQAAEMLPAGTKRIVLVRGASGIAAGPLAEDLRARGYHVTPCICAGEPSVASINGAVAAVSAASAEPVDVVIACGGGAVLDSGKAIAFCLGAGIELTEDFSEVPAALLAKAGPVPCIAVPTTAGTGAEVTANAVLELPSQHAKVSLRGPALIPSAALVDPLLLPSAPRGTVLSSGLDAVVQTIEAYTSCAATPFSDALVQPNITRGLRALKDVLETGQPEAWRDLAWVSLCSGIALANAGLGAAHGLASVIGGRFGAPHGALCGRFLAPVLRQNLAACDPGSDTHERIAACIRAIDEVFPPAPGQDALSGLVTWHDGEGLARLGAFGVEAAQIPELAIQSAAASSSKKNAVVLSEAGYGAILHAAL